MRHLSPFLTLRNLLRDTAPYTGKEFLRAAVNSFARHLDSCFVFVTEALDEPARNVRVLSAWRAGEEIDGWDFSLPGTPCELIYADMRAEPWVGMRVGGSVLISEDVCRRFEPARDTPFESFIGVPLWNGELKMIGHLALFFERRLDDQDERAFLIEVAELFSYKIQAELVRMLLERRQEELFEELRRANEQLARESITDSLTRLYNRRYFTQRMQQEFARYRRSRAPFALLLLDLDNFKHVNDRYGHDAGDALLREVARVFAASIRSDIEVVFRIGGEEFAILCHGVMTSHVLQELGERVNQGLRALAFAMNGHGIPVSVSIGGALPAEDDATWEAVYVRADAALYAAKRRGRDCTVVHDSRCGNAPGVRIDAT